MSRFCSSCLLPAFLGRGANAPVAGDGECATKRKLDNCGESDLYRVLALGASPAPTPRPTTGAASSPRPTIGAGLRQNQSETCLFDGFLLCAS